MPDVVFSAWCSRTAEMKTIERKAIIGGCYLTVKPVELDNKYAFSACYTSVRMIKLRGAKVRLQAIYNQVCKLPTEFNTAEQAQNWCYENGYYIVSGG